ncbi:MAG: pirin-like C-terminal cupin domain-containing protein, partial [Candidatus Competibacteraceae bacterium]|nr:pirin-like C-terminal cupin domain-containing protein [Candidatus Competibacteraceae bacterium]
PGRDKMRNPAYRDIPARDIPTVPVPGGRIKVVAGSLVQGAQSTVGPVSGGPTDPLYLDLDLQAGIGLTIPVPQGHRVLLYPYQGAARVAGEDLTSGLLAVLGQGDEVELSAGPQGLRALLLAARPLREPVAHYGPFVMNSNEEIQQALRDYRDGRLTA